MQTETLVKKDQNCGTRFTGRSYLGRVIRWAYAADDRSRHSHAEVELDDFDRAAIGMRLGTYLGTYAEPYAVRHSEGVLRSKKKRKKVLDCFVGN